MKEEQGKKTSPVISDAALKEVIPAKPTGDLSDEDLDKVAGGSQVYNDAVVLGADTARLGVPPGQSRLNKA